MQTAMARDIADKIRGNIVLRGLAPGEQLPTEATLMTQYGVSRSTVREAMKLLQAEHIVEIRRGLGSFVASKTGIGEDPLGLQFAEQEHLLENLMEVRLLMEPAIAKEAAARRTEEDIGRMEENIRLMREAAAADRDYIDYDYGFHTAVVESVHNSVLERIYPVIFEAITRGYEQTSHVHGSVDRALGYHRSILDAIIDGDGKRAADCTRRHIQQSLRDIAQHKKGEKS